MYGPINQDNYENAGHEFMPIQEGSLTDNYSGEKVDGEWRDIVSTSDI